MRTPRLSHILSTAAVVALLAASAGAGEPAAAPAPADAAKPTFGSFGVDTAGMDSAVAPGDDFATFAGGGWIRTTEIPADRASFGMFQRLQDLSLARSRAILDEEAKVPGSKIGDFYASFMDEAAVEAKGLTPIKPWLDQVKAIADKSAFAATMGAFQRQGVGGLIGVGVGQDRKAPENYVVQLRQAGLGMPDRDYYLKDDPKLADIRTKYVAYLAQMLTLAGESDAPARAAALFEFEKAVATAHWTRIESRDADKTYNKWTAADFGTQAPGFDWIAYGHALGVDGQPTFIVGQPSALTGEAKLIAATPLPVLKDYLTLRVMRAFAGYLPRAVDSANFDFTGTVLAGTPQQQERWKRGVTVVSGALGDDLGKIYVARHFPPATKAVADDLVKNVIAAMDARLAALKWMAPETRVKARAKLAAFRPKIGYPSQWKDYATVKIARDDLVGNVARTAAYEYDRGLGKLGGPIDREEWQMTPMTINAYANPVLNEIVFPAAILQPPFFDPKADPAVNYGGIGAVIGHEISHHFDDQGRKYDATGKLADWWTPQDVAQFKAFTDSLVAQYDAYEPLPGQRVQGALTLGENIADLAGLTVAIDAYHRSLKGKRARVIAGTTGDQRFYLGWAQVWRVKYREPTLRSLLLSDPHSPGPQRTATVRNLDPWYAAFGVKPGGKLYLAPEDRIRIW